MLRPSIARKVLRLRSARILSRAYQTPLPQNVHGPVPNDYLTLDMGNISSSSQITTTFPLYRPPDHSSSSSNPSDFDLATNDNYFKFRLTELADSQEPEMEEENLREFYSALVASGVDEAVTNAQLSRVEAPKDTLTIGDVERREVLLALESRLNQSNLDQTKKNGAVSSVTRRLSRPSSMRQSSLRILETLSGLNVPSSRAVFSVKGKGRDIEGPNDLPLGLVTRKEWDALFEALVEANDTRAAENLVAIMMQHGVQPDVTYVERIMRMDAEAGRSGEVARLTTGLAKSGSEISPFHHELFLNSLLHSTPFESQNAITYLREFENRGQPLPQTSYDLVLSHLTTPSSTFQPNSHCRSLAWDLFHHMRLKAHPIPTKQLYTTMIRTCGDPRDPQPERARDLWIEMTQEGNKVSPTREEYDAIIRALGSTKKDYLEAFELLRQMLAKHHDATFVPFEDTPKSICSPFIPTRETFTALLEGTKRAGDLERARWVLSEMIGLARSSTQLQGEHMPGPDEEMMSSLFMTYAAWRPTVKRTAVNVRNTRIRKDVDLSDKEDEDHTQSLDAINLDDITSTSVASSSDPDSATAPPRSPKTSADALREATALFQRILSDAQTPSHRANPFSQPFASLQITRRLINSYLSVHLAHGSMIDANKVWAETWSNIHKIKPKVNPNGWSYALLLERCAAGRKPGETVEHKVAAIQWGKAVWPAYRKWVEDRNMFSTPDTTRTEADNVNRTKQKILAKPAKPAKPPTIPAPNRRAEWVAGMGERQIEQCWRSIIRLYAISDDLSTSLSLLREFHTLYPPERIVETFEPLPRSNLGLAISDYTTLTEPHVPPHLLFTDVNVLHERFVRDENWVGVGSVKYVVKGYETALMRRRDWRMSGKGRRVGKGSCSIVTAVNNHLEQGDGGQGTGKGKAKKQTRDRKVSRGQDVNMEDQT